MVKEHPMVKEHKPMVKEHKHSMVKEHPMVINILW